jgi:hypothetical protein
VLELKIDNKKYRLFIEFAIETCSSFSVVFEKDCLNNSKYILQDFYLSIKENLINKKSIGQHPDTGTHFENSDLVKIECCEATRRILKRAAQISDWNGNEFPEELCFYRDDEKWFTYIFHEKLLLVYKESKDDMEFLNKEHIEYNVVI